jgi:TolA-binding protein
MEAEESVNYEAEAAKEGWAPLEQWKGDPEKWKSAEQFVEDGKNISGILKHRVEKLDERVNQLLESNQKLNELSQKQLKKEQEEKQKVISELEEMRKRAVTEGDGDAFAQADKQIQELRTPEKPQTPQLDPLAEQWLSDNSWYKTDDTLAAFADGIADRIAGSGFRGQAYYNELTKRVKDTFPDKFKNPNRDKPNGVETAGEQVVASKDRTFEKLPKDAKDAYAQFKRDIPGFSKEQYLASYDWE